MIIKRSIPSAVIVELVSRLGFDPLRIVSIVL